MRAPLVTFIIAAFLINSLGPMPVQAQEFVLPKPGVMVDLSPRFNPAHLKGMVIHPENPFKFDFVAAKGDEALTNEEKYHSYKKLIKYFLASLAVPDEDQWVNLSPYEKDRIIKEDFGKTEMGRDLLAQDYVLKQITASLIYPDKDIGMKFWEKIYEQAYKQYGSTNIPVNTFNKVWIIPDSASVYEHGNMVYVVNQHLKVMLEEDYISLGKHQGVGEKGPKSKNPDNKTHELGSQIVREIILPELEKEVNEGKNFAMLRQVYSSMILATWYKQALKESLLGKIYIDKAKIKGVDQDPRNNQDIYQSYLKAFKKGVFDYIKEDVDKYTKEIVPRKYFSGGCMHIPALKTIVKPVGLDQAEAGMEEEPTELIGVEMSEQVVSQGVAQHNSAMNAVPEIEWAWSEMIPAAELKSAMVLADSVLISEAALPVSLKKENVKYLRVAVLGNAKQGFYAYFSKVVNSKKVEDIAFFSLGKNQRVAKSIQEFFTTDEGKDLYVKNYAESRTLTFFYALRPKLQEIADAVSGGSRKIKNTGETRTGGNVSDTRDEKTEILKKRNGKNEKMMGLQRIYPGQVVMAIDYKGEEVEVKGFPQGLGFRASGKEKFYVEASPGNSEGGEYYIYNQRLLVSFSKANGGVFFSQLNGNVNIPINGLVARSLRKQTSGAHDGKFEVEPYGKPSRILKVASVKIEGDRLILSVHTDEGLVQLPVDLPALSRLMEEENEISLEGRGVATYKSFKSAEEKVRAIALALDGSIIPIGVSPNSPGFYQVLKEKIEDEVRIAMTAAEFEELRHLVSITPQRLGLRSDAGQGVLIEIVDDEQGQAYSLGDQKAAKGHHGKIADKLKGVLRKSKDGDYSLMMKEHERIRGEILAKADSVKPMIIHSNIKGDSEWFNIDSEDGYFFEPIQVPAKSMPDSLVIYDGLSEKFANLLHYIAKELMKVSLTIDGKTVQVVAYVRQSQASNYTNARLYVYIKTPGVKNSEENLKKISQQVAVIVEGMDLEVRTVFHYMFNDNSPAMNPNMEKNLGGVDFNAANLNLQIKRDGKGVPLPVSQQDLEKINIDGLVPIIVDIKPITRLPVIFE